MIVILAGNAGCAGGAGLGGAGPAPMVAWWDLQQNLLEERLAVMHSIGPHDV
jgi:hypothetical protein